MAVNVLKQGSRLPSEYQEVEYIEGNIDTGEELEPKNVSETYEIVQYMEGDNNGYFFSNDKDTLYCRLGLRLLNDVYKMWFYFGGNNNTSVNYAPVENKINKIQLTKNAVANNGTMAANCKYYDENDILLGTSSTYAPKANVDNWYTKFADGLPKLIIGNGYKLYSFKKVNGKELIPCYRKSDSTVGMYDITNNTFIAATGTFSKGNDVQGLVAQKVKINLTRLPSAYQEVEYIASNGNPYINTGIKLTSEDIVKCKFEITANTATMADAIYGAYDNPNFFVLLMRSPTQARVGTSSNQTTSTNYALNTLYETSLTNGRYIENGTAYGFTPATDFTMANSCYVMSRNQAGNTLPVSAKVYSFEIVGKFNGIPCYRKSDNVIGMYDTVSKTFFTNAGSGSFTKGSDKLFQKLSVNLLSKSSNLLNIFRQDWNTDNKQPTDTVTFDYSKLYYMASSGYIRQNPHTLNEKITLSSVNYTQTSSSWWGIGFPIEVKPNTKYTIGSKRLDGVNTKINYSLYNADGTFDSYAQITTNTSNLSPTITITTGANIKTLVVLICGISTNADVYAYDLQVVEGQALPEFKPYNEVIKI